MADNILPGIHSGMSNEELLNAVAKMQKELDYLLNNLDSLNVTSINTNLTTVSSSNGETIINGSLIDQYDSSGVLRARRGLDTSTNTFYDNVYNKAGNLTYSLDSNGNVVVETGTFKGSITIGTGNNVFNANSTNGIWLGHADYASAPFKVSLAGSASATGLTVSGGTITGALIRTAASGQRTEISTSGGFGSTPALIQYDTDGNKAVSIESSTAQGIIYFWNSTTNIGYIIGSSTNLSIYPASGKTMVLGYSGRTTYPYGTWDCTNATFTNLTATSITDGTYSYVTTNNSYLTGTGITGGSFTTTDGKTVSYNSDGLITSVV